MSSNEFAEWQSYIEFAGPLGPKRFYLGIGLICAAIYNSRRTKDSQPILSPDDFIPRFRETSDEVAARQKTKIDQFVASFAPPEPTPRRVKKD